MLEQKFYRFSITENMISWWQDFTFLQVSFFRSEGKCSHLWFYLKIIILYNIIVLCGFVVLMLCTSVNDIFILWSYCILFYIILFSFHCEISWGTDVVVLRSISFGKPYEAWMFWWWGHLFVFISEMENRTFSQMYGRLYSLHIILKLSTVVVWPVVF